MERPKLEKAINESLATYEGLRKLGFLPDEIFLEGGIAFDTGLHCVYIRLQSQGKRFTFNCGPIEQDLSQEEVCARWKDRAEWWNKVATNAEHQAIYRKSFIRRNRFLFVTRLLAKGIEIRRLPGA